MSALIKYLRAGAEVNANGDYSDGGDGVTDFSWENDTTQDAKIRELFVYVEDALNPMADEYGNLGSALANGVELILVDETGATVLDITDGLPIKSNAQWRALCQDAGLQSFAAGSSNEVVFAHLLFATREAALNVKPGHKFIARLNDDFSGLAAHYFHIHGVQETI